MIILNKLNYFFLFNYNFRQQMENSKAQQKIETIGNHSLHKLITFIQYHLVDHKEIWNSKPFIRISQFAETIQQKYGYKVNSKQILGLGKIADKGENLYVQNFHKVGVWNNAVYQIKQNKTSLCLKQKNRPYTATQKQFTKMTKTTQYNKPTYSNITKKLSHTQTDQMFQSSRLKQNLQLLEHKIVENSLDKKWQYVIKVGEMNAWLKSLQQNQKNMINFQQLQKQNLNEIHAVQSTKKVYKIHGIDQNIQIIQQKQNGIAQVLPLKVFDQKYQSMKKKCTIQQKMKNNMKGTMLLVLDKKQKVSKAKLGEKISQRDQQLNYLLLQIMRLKNIFQQQQQILHQCGINS